MLVLSRKLGEKIIIGDNIEVMVVGVCGNRVRLGIAAPTECRISRAEKLVAGQTSLAAARVPDLAQPQLLAECGS